MDYELETKGVFTLKHSQLDCSLYRFDNLDCFELLIHLTQGLNMSSNNILSPTLIESGRDIPLKELLFAKRVLDNYLAVAQETSPIELLDEMRDAAKGVEYFKTDSNPCEARNVISEMFSAIDASNSFDDYKVLAGKPRQALNELIEDRAQLIKHERGLLLAAGYDFSRI